jgi:hypothetical protein
LPKKNSAAVRSTTWLKPFGFDLATGCAYQSLGRPLTQEAPEITVALVTRPDL